MKDTGRKKWKECGNWNSKKRAERLSFFVPAKKKIQEENDA